MNTLTPEQIKERIIQEINIGHLTQEEQDEVINKLSEALLMNASFELMKRVPEDVLPQFDALEAEGKHEEFQQLLLQYVPDAQTVSEQAVRDGLEEYKQNVIANSADINKTEVLEVNVPVGGGIGGGVVVSAPKVPTQDALAQKIQEEPLQSAGLGDLQDAIASKAPDTNQTNTEPTLADALNADTSVAPSYTPESTGLPDIIPKDNVLVEDAPDSILDTLRTEVAKKKTSASTLIASNAVQAQTPLEQHFAVGADGEAEELGGGNTPQATL